MLSPPEGLEDAGLAAHRAAVEALEALAEDPKHARTALAAYARAIDTSDVIRGEWVRLGRPALSEGSSGQPVEHPLLGAQRDQAAHVARLAESLLLTPKARASARRAGWQRGSGRSSDRATKPGLRVVQEAKR